MQQHEIFYHHEKVSCKVEKHKQQQKVSCSEILKAQIPAVPEEQTTE